MSSKIAAFVVAAGLAVAVPATVRAQDGHPLIKAYAGSTLLSDPEVRSFDQQQIVVAKVQPGGSAKTEQLEGKVTRMEYQDPEGRSSLEVFRNYRQALAEGGFEIVYSCSQEECGPEIQVPTLGYYPPDRYVAARLTRPEGDVWVAVAVGAGSRTRIYVVEVKPMEAGMAAVNAAALSQDILADGHVAVYGVFFDTGKADLKPESAATLKAIAALLQGNPALKLHVVGHTDNAGALAANLDLSARRAAAVVAELTLRYQVAAARLRSGGVGPLSPIASNKTDAGRAKNRRVELVEQ
jgi:outer membrane protein OmpA-like peptidoglycan-associated protein